jgi:hypothetical protein
MPKPQITFACEVTNDTANNEESSSLLPSVKKPTGPKYKGSMSELFRIWEIRRNFFVLVLLMPIGSFCFFLITYEMKNMKGDMNDNNFSQALAVLVADVISGILYLMIGPKLGMFLSYLVAIIGCVAML